MLNRATTFSSFDGRCTLSREEVAELLNEALEEADVGNFDDVVHFASDDDRLTDEVCLAFACNMADFDDHLEAAENVLNAFPQICGR